MSVSLEGCDLQNDETCTNEILKPQTKIMNITCAYPITVNYLLSNCIKPALSKDQQYKMFF